MIFIFIVRQTKQDLLQENSRSLRSKKGKHENSLAYTWVNNLRMINKIGILMVPHDFRIRPIEMWPPQIVSNLARTSSNMASLFEFLRAYSKQF